MDGMLSQDEINALLNGMDTSDGGAPETIGSSEEVTEVPSSEPSGALPEETADKDALLTDVEKDAIGEVANISMGSSATTLYSLVNRKVSITTPVVEVARWENLLTEYERPCVFIQIKYTVGLDGTNILVLKEHDVKVITDLMMGGDGTNTDGELGELHLSAISEAMNQMMGSAATSLSTMLKTMIDISPPDASLLDLAQIEHGEEISPFLGGDFVKISFRMQIDELVDSTIMQLYPIEFARKVVDTFIGTQDDGGGTAEPAGGTQEAAPVQEAAPAAGQMNQQEQVGVNPQMGMQMGMMGMNPQTNMQNVNVQPAQFQTFSTDGRVVPGQENIGLIMDVPLEVTVELGRTTKSISEILNFAPGTIIELDRIAGEPIDVLVNGKFVARGEVVVIEESFGVRVTEIIK
jgi:flagellar motor switch protein FliN/FliY